MKKLLLVIAILASFVAGIITTVYFSTLFNLNNPESPEVTNESLNVSKESYSNEDLSGLTIFAEKGECLEIKNKVIEIKKVLKPNMALAYTGDILYGGVSDIFMPDELEILIINYEDKHFYDKQQIKIPKGKCARQIGIYKNSYKTVPAVVIE